nr:type IV secretion system protein [Alysiella crassa]
MAGTFWKDTTDFLLDGLGTNLFAQSANLISSIAPLFSMGFGIYFMIIILNAYGRGFDGNAIDFAKKTVAWLIIIACAFNATQYQKIAGMLYEFPEWLAGIINGNFDVGAIDVAWDSITQAVSQITEQASDLGMTDFADKLMFYIAAGFLICCGIVFFGIVVAYYLVAKISLAMVLLIIHSF